MIKTRTRIKWIVLLVTAICMVLIVAFQRRGEIFSHFYEHKKIQLAELAPMAAVSIPDSAIINVNVAPMTSDTILRNYSVLVRHGKIAALGPADEISVPPGVALIDGNGAYLTPGLADMHVHMDGIALNHKLFLVNGVTSVREMSGTPEVLDWQRKIANNTIFGPDIYTTGPILRGRDTGSAASVLVETPQQAEAEVMREYQAGYRAVKPYTYLAADAYKAIVTKARALGMAVVGHIPYSVGTRGAVAAGQDEIAHIHSFHGDFFVNFDKTRVFQEYPIDTARMAEIVPLIADAGIRVTTTLIVNQVMVDAQDLDRFLHRPMQDYEPGWARLLIGSPEYMLRHMWDTDYLNTQYLPWIYALIKALHDAGVLLVLGTDSGVPGLVHGFSTHEELRLLVKAGLTPYEAWLTATRNAATAVAAQEKWGVIEKDMRADFILLTKNPFTDIRNSTSIIGVMKNGRWFDKQALDGLRAEIKQAVN